MRSKKYMIPKKEITYQQQTEGRTKYMNDNTCRVEAHEDFWRKTCALVLVCFLIAYLILAMILPNGPYGESGSILLSSVSLISHGSFRITPEDLEKACDLFPEQTEYFRAYYTVLPEALEGGRYPFYLGVYAPLCIPTLSILRLMHLDATYAFSITNALLLSLALWFVYRFAKIREKQKILAIILLGTSPILRYINVQLYETALFSFVVIAMVFWFNRSRKLAAFFLAIAGTMNSTVMAFGFFMILDYFLEMFKESNWSAKAFFKRFATDWEKTAGLAVCFLPCFVPFVISRIGLGCWYFISNMGTLQGVGGRFLAYLFDLNLGLFPYFPLLLFLFSVVAVWGGVHGKRDDMLCTFFGTLAVIGGYSMIYRINCGMIGIARYNAWLIPIIALGTVYYTDISFSGTKTRQVSYVLTALSCVWCVFVIGITAYSTNSGNYIWWSPVAETVLEYAPGMYDPLPSTFYSRTLHLDGAYGITDPAYYCDPQTNEVRKLIYKADEGQAERVLNELKGDEKSVAYLREKLKDNGVDGKYHYIDFPASGAYQLVEKTPEDLGFADAAIVAEGQNLMLESDGNCLITALPFTIKENTIYKIEAVFENNSVLPKGGELYVDLYGPNYDRREQEVNNFLRNGIYSYTFYFDSGAIDGSSLNGFVRVFSADKSLPIKMELLRVTEMERLN